MHITPYFLHFTSFLRFICGTSIHPLLLTCKENTAVRVHLSAILWISLQRYSTTRAPWWLLPLQAKCIFCLTFPNCQRLGEQKPYIHPASKCQKHLGLQKISACNKAKYLLLFMKSAERSSCFIIYDDLLSASSLESLGERSF